MSGLVGSGKTDPRIGYGDRDVSEQVPEDGQDARQHGVGEKDVVVEVAERLEEQEPEARIVEEDLGQQVPGQRASGIERPTSVIIGRQALRSRCLSRTVRSASPFARARRM